MKDRVPVYPGRVKLVPVSGQSNVYDMVRADQPTQAGDPLNKATLLKDATAALFGLGTDAVPDDVLQKLAGAAFNSGGTITDVNGNPLGVRIATGSYVGTGTYGEDNPNSLTFEFEPKFLIVQRSTTNYPGGFIWIDGISEIGSVFTDTSSGASLRISIIKNEKDITWYSTSNAEKQMNLVDSYYYYIAIG